MASVPGSHPAAGLERGLLSRLGVGDGPRASEGESGAEGEPLGVLHTHVGGCQVAARAPRCVDSSPQVMGEMKCKGFSGSALVLLF